MSKIKILSSKMDIARELSAIRNEAKSLSGYTDMDYGYAGTDVGAASIDAAIAAARHPILDFKFSIKNSGSAAVDRVIALLSPFGYSETELAAAGQVVDGVLRDGQVVPGATPTVNDVIGAGVRSNRPIALLTKYAAENPLRVIGLTISSSNTRSFETDLQIMQLNPFKQEEERTVDLSNYFRADNLTGKKIEADLVNDGLDFSMDNQTLIKWIVPAGTDAIVTLRFGGVDNRAAKFAQRAELTTVNAQTRMEAMGSDGRASVIASKIGALTGRV